MDDKGTLRRTVQQGRRERSATARADVAEALAAHLLALPSVGRARRVAAYRSMADEPGTGPLLDALLARGVEVLVPVSLEDEDGRRDLAWVAHDPAADVVRSRLGVDEPQGARLDGSALLTADVVLLPALAADHAGRRLGRGAGYYDRALAAALPPGARRPLLVAVVHADELLPEVPHEPHDVPVDLVVTEAGVFRVP